MRTYGKVTPGFWIGETGRQLRAAGAEVQVVALYLLSSPHARMIGCYYQPLAFIAHETGLAPDAVRRAIEKATEIGFCDYDYETEFVWVYEMARFQIGEQLTANDKRCKGVQQQYLDLPDNRFLRPFFERYAKTFHLSTSRDGGTSSNKLLPSSIEAPSKPLRSQEQEQEHEQEKEKTKALSGEAPDDEFEVAWKALPKRSGNNPKADALKAWKARLREGVKPTTMIEGAERYRALCEATAKAGTEFVMQAARFFGSARPFEQDFTLPAAPMNGKPPWYLSAREIEARGRARGFEVPTLTGDFPTFRQQVYAAEGITPEMVDAARKDFP